ncbi:MAG: hypothetical protein HY855_06355 [Burkholderiales bacterium]|nr:hypothetical protein [Burkholderiales bacterium]
MRITFKYLSGGQHALLGEVLYPAQLASDGANQTRFQRYLASPIGSVARDVEACDRVLSMIRDVERGRVETAHHDADDVELTLTRHAVQVDIVVNDQWVDNPDGRFDLETYRLVLEGWRQFLGLPKRLDSIVEVALPDDIH